MHESVQFFRVATQLPHIVNVHRIRTESGGYGLADGLIHRIQAPLPGGKVRELAAKPTARASRLLTAVIHHIGNRLIAGRVLQLHYGMGRRLLHRRLRAF